MKGVGLKWSGGWNEAGGGKVLHKDDDETVPEGERSVDGFVRARAVVYT